MALLSVIRIFVMAIFFNMFLPSGDVYSDIYLMYQTWNFENTESLEMFGCKACYGKTEQDLYTSDKRCETCITKIGKDYCPFHLPFMNKYLEKENKYNCENEKWRMNFDNGIIEKGVCDDNHYCCFKTKNSISKMKNNDKDKMKPLQFHSRILVDCDDEVMKNVANSELYDTCLLSGKQTGLRCSLGVKYDKIYIEKKMSELLIDLEENKLINFTSRTFTGIALEFLFDEIGSLSIIPVTSTFFLHNNTTSDLSAIALGDIEYLNKDESFECGAFIKPKTVNIIGDNTGVDCGLSTCKLHIDMIHNMALGSIYDLQTWNTKNDYVLSTQRVGGKTCQLLRIYAWTMFIPILINFLLSGVIFYLDVKSGDSSMFEIPFLLLLLYPQWRTLKILIRYFTHSDQEELTNELDENEKQLSFIEPFCESGFQVSDSNVLFIANKAAKYLLKSLRLRK